MLLNGNGPYQFPICIYCIHGIIGESNIWRFTLKMQLARFFYLAILSTVWKETHAYSLNGIHLIWQYLRHLPNRQIKATAKYTTYTVAKFTTYYGLL